MSKIVKWGDDQQYVSRPIQEGEERGPRVVLLAGTPDPLGAIAAMCRMYGGRPTYSLDEITDEERLHYWKQANATHLKAPLEAPQFHFFIEGVDRAFTHQMVRQREAVYAQESMRFAVVEDLPERAPLPPFLAGLPSDDPRVTLWRMQVEDIAAAYSALVDGGVPAEEARGLLPHATLTRLHYITNLRRLLYMAGNRLCTQAQFHWRLVLTRMMRAIRDYYTRELWPGATEQLPSGNLLETAPRKYAGTDGQLLVQAFAPVCYELRRCPFGAEFDRKCSIRERVQDFGRAGLEPEQWHDASHTTAIGHNPIHPSEWLLDPAAAR